MDTLKTTKTIVAQDITPEAFEPFGGVISSTHQLEKVETASANQGTATKLLEVSPITNNFANCPSQTPAKAKWNMFQCTPPKHLIEGNVYTSKVLERHPFSSQTFLPLGRNKTQDAYIVIVAPTGANGLPDLDGVVAFKCRGDQAVTYNAATWHAPMVTLGEVTDFAVLIHENGVPDEDCQEVYLDVLKVEF